MRLTQLFAVCVSFVVFALSPAAADIVRTDNVEAELIAERAGIAPGETIYVGLRKTIRDHWHTYWRNAGDAGEPTVIVWDLPEGFSAGEIVWPIPEVITLQGVVSNYGYEGELILPSPVTAPADAVVGDVITLNAHAMWLVCEDICIPEEAHLSLRLPVVDAPSLPHPVWAEPIAQVVADAPRPADVPASLSRRDELVRLTVADQALADAAAEGSLREVHFFPFEGDAIDHNAPQGVSFGTEGLAVDLAPAFGLRDHLRPTAGVLAFDALRDGAWMRMGVEIAAEPGEALDIGAAVAPVSQSSGGGGFFSGGGGLVGYIVGAFIGGLILNLMPCVFPVLSIKALGFVQHAHDAPGEVRRHGLMFLAGVLATFTLLSLALAALKTAGVTVGWGFQLQEPVFVAALALVMFAIGLNLLGVFEIGASLQGSGAGLAARSGDVGAFFTGVLAVVVATPCTAPFMAAAIGFCLVQPVLVATLVFWALGLGLAAPFVALSFAPGLLRYLPKPGPWMDTLKQAFAFPMFATAIWLLWTIAQQAGANGVGAALLAMLGFGFVVWAFKQMGEARSALVWIGRATSIAVLAATLALMATVRGGDTAGAVEAGQASLLDDGAWSRARVAELQAEGKAVFVDFTAAWCITCQFNKRTVLHSDAVQTAFADHGVTFLTADWTNRDDVIAGELAAHGRSGVPLYLLYAPTADTPAVLPQVLTKGLVVDAVEQLRG